MPGQHPSAAFAFALVAAIFHAIGGFLVDSVFAFLPKFVVPLSLVGTALAVLFVLLAFVGAYWLYSGQKTRVTYGGVLTLLVAILAVPTGWGLIVGSLMGFIAGILGLVWEPPIPSRAIRAPPPPGPP